MSAKLKYQDVKSVGRSTAAAIIATASVMGSLFFGSAYAADKPMDMPMHSTSNMPGGMPMHSMEMHKSMMGGMKGMESMKASGDTDYDFAMMMKMHHQSALDMANVQLKNGKDAKLRSMATAIIKSQTKEIAEFDKWLAKNPQPKPSSMMKPK